MNTYRRIQSVARYLAEGEETVLTEWEKEFVKSVTDVDLVKGSIVVKMFPLSQNQVEVADKLEAKLLAAARDAARDMPEQAP